MKAAEELGREVGIQPACRALGVSRASLYRRRQGPKVKPAAPRRSPRALSGQEREHVRQTLYSERFVDKAPRQVYRWRSRRRSPM